MSSYTITIRADDANAETKVTVDDSGGRPKVTEVSVRATSGGGLSAQQLSAIDPDLLLRAVAPRAATKATSSAAGGPSAAPRKATAKRATKKATARKAGAKKAGAKKATGTKATVRRAKRTTASASGSTGARVYRRMPDDLAATFASVGSISAVARHYGVPRHTAQGWVARLRRG
jgi:hypothetical protein